MERKKTYREQQEEEKARKASLEAAAKRESEVRLRFWFKIWQSPGQNPLPNLGSPTIIFQIAAASG